jgi:hypothetical protein
MTAIVGFSHPHQRLRQQGTHGAHGLDRIEFGGQAVDSARVSRPEERIWDRHDVGSPMNTNSTQ